MKLECQNEIGKQLAMSGRLAVAVIDVQGGLIEVNQTFLYHFVEEGVLGGEEKLYDLINSIELQNKMKEVLKKREDRSEVVFPYCKQNNSVLWFRLEILYIDNKNTYMLLFHDLTEAYQAQMVLEAHLTISDDIFMFFDHHDHILHCSEKAANLFGFVSRREVLGLHYTTLMQGKVNVNIMEGVFEKLHRREGHLGYMSVREYDRNQFYELSAFHVNLQSISVGFVLLLKPLDTAIIEEDDLRYENGLLRETGEGPKESYGENVSLRESQMAEYLYGRQNMLDEETANLYWNSKECKERLKELTRAIQYYEYIEINTILESLCVLAPREYLEVLQNIQMTIMNLDYEKAMSILETAKLL